MDDRERARYPAAMEIDTEAPTTYIVRDVPESERETTAISKKNDLLFPVPRPLVSCSTSQQKLFLDRHIAHGTVGSGRPPFLLDMHARQEVCTVKYDTRCDYCVTILLLRTR